MDSDPQDMPGAAGSPAGADRTMDLLEAWCAGDRDAIQELVVAEAEWIQGRIRARRGPALARQVETMDQFQELMLGLLDYVPRFVLRRRGDFRALLARMIENDLVDTARKQQRRRDLMQQALAESRISLEPSRAHPTAASEAAVRSEELAWLRLGIEFLEPDVRRLVERHVFGQCTFRELESEFEASANALRNRYNRGVVRLATIVQRLQAGEVEMLDRELGDESGDT